MSLHKCQGGIVKSVLCEIIGCLMSRYYLHRSKMLILLFQVSVWRGTVKSGEGPFKEKTEIIQRFELGVNIRASTEPGFKNYQWLEWEKTTGAAFNYPRRTFGCTANCDGEVWFWGMWSLEAMGKSLCRTQTQPTVLKVMTTAVDEQPGPGSQSDKAEDKREGEQTQCCLRTSRHKLNTCPMEITLSRPWWIRPWCFQTNGWFGWKIWWRSL